jgi:hypothetical protein
VPCEPERGPLREAAGLVTDAVPKAVDLIDRTPLSRFSSPPLSCVRSYEESWPGSMSLRVLQPEEQAVLSVSHELGYATQICSDRRRPGGEGLEDYARGVLVPAGGHHKTLPGNCGG